MQAQRLISYATYSLAGLFLVLSVVSICGLLFIHGLSRDASPESTNYVTEKRVPGKTHTLYDPNTGPPAAPIVSLLTPGTGVASTTIKGQWPCFRGENLDGISKESVPLIDSFTKEGPPVLWGLDLGEGYAGAVVRNGRVYILDYDLEKRRDTLRCLSMDDGKEIWNYSYPMKVKRNHGMSRTLPSVTDKYCVSIGPKCHVSCVDALTGKEIWFIDMVKRYGTTVPEWYAGQCPLIVRKDNKETLILAPCGKDTMLCAIDLETGNERWTTPNPFGWKMTHVSVIPLELDGKKTYVYCGNDGVLGCDGETGKILWSNTDWKISMATCPSPIALPDARVFLCGGYKTDSAMLKIQKKPDGGYEAKTLFKMKFAAFSSTQQTPIFYDGHLFGVGEKDGELICFNPDGNIVWESGSKGKFGIGPYMIADGKILLLNDTGKLTIARASTKAYEPLGSFQVLEDGHDAWAPLALVEGRLMLREMTRMVCIDIRKK